MDRSWESNALGTVPAMPTTPSVGYPTDGNIVGLIPATNPGAWWFHMLTEEIRNVIAAAGLTPLASNVGQLLQALDVRYSGAGSSTAWSVITGHPTTIAGYGITDALGSGQNWVDVTSLRTPGVTYTNTTGKPIQMHIVTTPNAGLTLVINGVTIANLSPTSSYIVTMAPIIPAGATYLVSSAAIGFWMELR